MGTIPRDVLVCHRAPSAFGLFRVELDAVDEVYEVEDMAVHPFSSTS